LTHAATERALQLTQQAEKDLGYCSRFLVSTISPGHPMQEQRIKEAKFGAMLTMSNTEIDLGLLPEARAHLRSARRIISSLVDDARSLGSAPPDRVQLTQRLGEVEGRLQQ
jgi:hypothetical protein